MKSVFIKNGFNKKNMYRVSFFGIVCVFLLSGCTIQSYPGATEEVFKRFEDFKGINMPVSTQERDSFFNNINQKITQYESNDLTIKIKKVFFEKYHVKISYEIEKDANPGMREIILKCYDSEGYQICSTNLKIKIHKSKHSFYLKIGLLFFFAFSPFIFDAIFILISLKTKLNTPSRSYAFAAVRLGFYCTFLTIGIVLFVISLFFMYIQSARKG